MKATLEFNLPDDSAEWERASRYQQAFFLIYDITMALRRRLKYGDLPQEVRAELEAFQQLIYESDINDLLE